MRLVEHKRHGRTLPAIVNGLTAVQAQSQGLIEDSSENDNSSKRSSRRSSVADDEESLFLPNGQRTTKPSPEPMMNGLFPTAPKAQRTPRNGVTKQGPALNPSPPSSESSSSAQPRPFGSNVSTSSQFFGQPTVITPSQVPIQPFATQSPFLRHSNTNPTDIKRDSDPQTNLFKFTNDSNPSSIVSSIEDQPTSQAKPSHSLSDSTSTVTDQAATKPISATAATTPAKSILDFQSASTSETPKFTFGTSPLFNKGNAADAPQSKKPSAHEAPIEFGLGANKTTNQQIRPQEPPPSIHSPSTFKSTESFTSPFSRLPTSLPNKEPFLPPTSQTPLSSVFPLGGIPNPAEPLLTVQPQRPTFDSSPDLLRAVGKQVGSLSPQNPIDPLNRSEKGSSFPTPATTGFNPSTLTSTSPKSSSHLFAPSPQNSHDATSPTSDQRPIVLDALAERLMMDEQGLLRQFIEYAMGPIVRDAFREVEDERSWERAS